MLARECDDTGTAMPNDPGIWLRIVSVYGSAGDDLPAIAVTESLQVMDLRERGMPHVRLN